VYRRILGVAAALLLLSAATLIYRPWHSDAETNSTPGSTDDPIVTKSYVDQKLAEIQGGSGTGTGTAAAGKLEVVTVPVDKRIIVQDGGELIVRSGKAIAYSADANGLSDMTDGLDIQPGKPVAANHLILFPRGGRGVQADPKQKNGLIVLVRGGYQLQSVN
jgi:hypothetical protein